MKTSSLASEQRRPQWGPLTGIFDARLLHVLHRPGAGDPVGRPLGRGSTAENLSRQTSAPPRTCLSRVLPRAPAGLVAGSCCAWQAGGSRCKGLPACPALGGQHLCVRSSSLCISTPYPACLETRPRQLQFPSMLWKPLVQDTGVLWCQPPQALAGRGRGERQRSPLPPAPCQGQGWGEGLHITAVCSCFNLSTPLGVRVCYPPSQCFCLLKTPALPAGRRSPQGPGAALSCCDAGRGPGSGVCSL